MDEFEDGYSTGKNETREKLWNKYLKMVDDRSLVKEDIADLIEEAKPKKAGIFSILFGKPKEQTKPTEREQGYEKGSLEEKARFVSLFMDWFANLRTLDRHIYTTKFLKAVFSDSDKLDWQFVEPNTKDPPPERYMSGKYRR